MYFIAKLRRSLLQRFLEPRLYASGGLRQIDSWLQPRKASKHCSGIRFALGRFVESLGNKNVSRKQIRHLKIRRKYADDGGRLTVQWNCLGDNVGIPAKSALPEPVRDECNVWRVGSIFVR